MGNRQYNVKHSIKGQVIVAVILMLTCSFFATLVTYVGIAVSIRPSHASEKTASALEHYISTQGAAILNPSAQPKLQAIVKGGGVQYLVMDPSANPIYGTLVDSTVTSRADVYRKLNTVFVQRQGFVFGSTVNKVIPVISKNGSLVGAVYVRWDMFPGGARTPNLWTHAIGFAFLLSPFLYMLLFTYIFARRLGKRINQPLQALIEATRRIQQRDLDFTIQYEGTNEIGKVLKAFEDMRKGLKESLIAQWSLEAERREMLAAISHDLRTPITIIQGHAENLIETLNRSSEAGTAGDGVEGGDVEQRPVDDTAAIPENSLEKTVQGTPSLAVGRLRRTMETIERNTNRVVRLMNDFRLVTEIDSPAMALKPQKIDVERYIYAKYHEFQVVAAQHQISLQLEFTYGQDDLEDHANPGRSREPSQLRARREHRGPVSLYIDVDRVSQIIDNLMVNAIRFTPEGGKIDWHVVARKHRLDVIVQDNGQGLTTTDMGRLFNKFYQGDESRSAEKGHSGLGLYIVKVLVEKHGGTVSARHTPGGGATFQFFVQSLDGLTDE